MRTSYVSAPTLLLNNHSSYFYMENIIRKLFPGAPSVNERKLGIIGGNYATKGQFPYEVSFQACFNGQMDMCQHICGGAILSPTTVITAASCFPIGTLYTYRIVAGALNLTEDNPEKQIANITSFVFHPEYDVDNQ